MQLYSFRKSTAHPITQYNSVNAFVTPLINSHQHCTVVCIRIEAHGLLGNHRASQNQLLLVVEGKGQVCGDAGVFRDIHTDQAAFWQAGEYHTTRSETGLVAIVIEGEDVSPGGHMVSLSETE